MLIIVGLVTTWSAALDAQLDLIRFWRSEEGVQAANMTNLVPSMMQGWDADLANPEVQAYINRVGRSSAELYAGFLDRGATYFVTSEVTPLLETAGAQLPVVAPIREELPQPSGFVYFQTPIALMPTVLDEDLQKALEAEGSPNGTDNSLRVVQWAHHDEELVVIPYFGGMISITPFGTPLGAYHWKYGEPLPEKTEARDEMARLLIAFWLLSQQRIAQAHVRQIDRHARRRAVRANFEVPEDGIRVVTLRRLAPEPGAQAEPAEVDWSHRWIVGGHWRQQWYPSVEDHRPVWIAPHVKGPEDKPLVLKDRVYRFSR